MRISSIHRWRRKFSRWLQEPANWSLLAMIRPLSKTYDIPLWVYWLALASPFFWPLGDLYLQAGDLTFFGVMVPGLSITLFQQTVSEVMQWIAMYGVVLGLVIASVLMRLNDPFGAIAFANTTSVRLMSLQAPPPLVGNIASVCLSDRLLPIPRLSAR